MGRAVLRAAPPRPCRSVSTFPRGGGAITLTRVLVVALLLVGLVAPPAAAETFVQLWPEDFCDGSDWVIDANVDFDTAPPCIYRHIEATAAWEGPTYRSAAGSTWNTAASTTLKIQMEDLKIALASGTQNRQFGFGIDSDHHVFDSTGADYLEFRFAEDDASPFYGWNVLWRDDGGSVHLTQHATQGIEGVSQLDANITVNIPSKRYWINWTYAASSGAITALWTDDVDGPFAEASAFHVNLWSYNTFVGVPEISLDALTISETQDISAAPQPDPAGRDHHIIADYTWTQTEFGTQFYDTSTADSTIVQWRWNFGDDYGSQRQHPFHSFMCRGNYTVELEVTDEFGAVGRVVGNVFQPDNKPLCGVLTRGEEGVKIGGPNPLLEIPTAFFIGLAAFSATSLALGIEFPLLGTKIRVLMLLISVVMLALTFGLIGMIVSPSGA